MGRDIGDGPLQREWMPSVDAFFGEDTGCELDEMSLSRTESEHYDDSASSHDAESRDELDSAKGICESHGDCCSMKSGCLDPPAEENRSGSEGAEHLAHIQRLAGRCSQLEMENDLLRKKLKAKGSCGDSELQKWLQLPSVAQPESGTFDAFYRTWESQRDLLLERLREKEKIISRQADLLSKNSKTVSQLAAGLDGLETRFNREILSYKTRFEDLELVARKKIDSLDAVHAEIEKRQRKTKTEIQRCSTSIKADIASLEKALRRRTALYTQSEIEKQAVIKKLDSAEEERGALKGEVTRLTEKLSAAKTKNLKLQRGADDGLHSQRVMETPQKESVNIKDSNPCISTREATTAQAARKENFQLKREMLEMQEKLVDLKEHCEELESQVQEQQEAFHQSRCQLHEFEFLKRTKQDLVAILTAKQRTINGLRQSLSSLRSEMRQAPEAIDPKEKSFLEEILAAQARCEELESLFINAQSERDHYRSEIFRLEEVVHSMNHEAKRQKRSMTKLKREQAALLKTANCQKSEIATLQTNLRVQALQMTSNSREKMENSREIDLDVMKELLKSKLAVAEMTDVVAQLRNELSLVKQKNKPTKRTNKHGYHHLLLKTLTGVLSTR